MPKQTHTAKQKTRQLPKSNNPCCVPADKDCCIKNVPDYKQVPHRKVMEC